MSVKNSIQAVPQHTINSAVLDPVVYQVVYAPGLDQSCFLLRILNINTQSIVISYDGVNDHDALLPNGILEVYGGEGSSQPTNSCALWRKGQPVYVRGTAGVGRVVVCGYYQPQGA